MLKHGVMLILRSLRRLQNATGAEWYSAAIFFDKPSFKQPRREHLIGALRQVRQRVRCLDGQIGRQQCHGCQNGYHHSACEGQGRTGRVAMLLAFHGAAFVERREDRNGPEQASMSAFAQFQQSAP
jgi:hypothetical protein